MLWWRTICCWVVLCGVNCDVHCVLRYVIFMVCCSMVWCLIIIYNTDKSLRTGSHDVLTGRWVSVEQRRRKKKHEEVETQRARAHTDRVKTAGYWGDRNWTSWKEKRFRIYVTASFQIPYSLIYILFSPNYTKISLHSFIWGYKQIQFLFLTKKLKFKLPRSQILLNQITASTSQNLNWTWIPREPNFDL